MWKRKGWHVWGKEAFLKTGQCQKWQRRGKMTAMREKTNHFGFPQLRFVIAAVLLFAAGLKAYQLATAPLPPVVQGSLFTPFLELLNNRHLQMFVVVGEIFFALVLIVNLWRSWMWLLSLLGFTAFTLVSVMKGISGEASCGCFGTVTVNPWLTATFDAAIVGLLLIFRERIDWKVSALDGKKVLAVVGVWLVLAVPTLFFMLSLKEQPHATLGTEFVRPDAKRMIHLEPEKWIGKEFPLFPYFAEFHKGDFLKQGDWDLLLIHTDCLECAKMMEELEEKKPKNVAIVIIPSRVGDEIPQASSPTFVLDDKIDWYAKTPCVIRLSEGICVSTGEQVGERS